MTDRLSAAFADGNGKRAALMPYLMGGFPSVEVSREAALAAAAAGGDVLELGVPVSDPLADGPGIHAAATAALSTGARLDDVLGICRAVSGDIPVVLMVYANPILARGQPEFAHMAADAGAAGIIVPDLPHGEAGELRAACDSAGIALVPLVAPTSTDARIAEVGRDARGFVYTVSTTGTTGERSALPPEIGRTVERVRASTKVPVAVGFGISTPEQAAEVGEIADGVIVGSRVVRAAGEGGADAVGQLVRDLAEALAR